MTRSPTVKYSVLLPTRNGGALLERCVGSILGQPYGDMELVVSNNASEDETAEILDTFSEDERLRVVQLAEPVSVTQNWNVALSHARGQRILLIGDDDLLLANYFDRVDGLLDRYSDPDVLSYNAFAYAYPGFAGSLHSHYADPFFESDARIPRGGVVPQDMRLTMVADVFRFVFPIALNMQTVVIARRALSRLTCGLFKEPFPDFYAISALLLRADRWVNVDDRLLVVGVSPKSFGRTLHRSDEQARGVDYLGIDTDFEGRLPGSEFLNGTYRCLIHLRRDYLELARFEVHRPSYVLWQVYDWYVQLRLRTLSPRQVMQYARLLRLRDWPALVQMLALRMRPSKLVARLRVDRHDPAPQLWPGMQPLPEVDDIGEFADWIVAERRE
ncbi:MAG: glycosyltransferase family 2 protein [Gaiellaceae bacterium]